jgi:hypothetical protein
MQPPLGLSVMGSVPRARVFELDPIRELPSGPAACEPHERLHTWQP